MSAGSVEQASWFATQLLARQSKSWSEISSPLSTYSPVGYTDLESTLVRSAKIRIYPSVDSISTFRRFNGLSRFWYNKAVEELKKPGRKSLYDLRELQRREGIPDWALDCPQRIREHALADAADAVIRAKKAYKKSKKIQHVKFRSKRNPKQGFGFDLVSLKEDFLFTNKKWRLKFHATEELKHILKTAKEGTRVVQENGHWFITIPRTVQQKSPENQRVKFVALDPGVRTFQTIYSDSILGKIGTGDFSRIFRLCLCVDDLVSRSRQAKGLKRLALKRANKRLRRKIKDLIQDLHYKTANFLCRNFETILIPTFETSKMTKRTSRKIGSKTARAMLTFAHYRFKEFLKVKAEEFGCRVVEVSEAYTSKTCSYCGNVQEIGSRKIFKCKSCGAVIDRDLNGARGIYLRALGASPIIGFAPVNATAELCNRNFVKVQQK
jgi:putative transposase